MTKSEKLLEIMDRYHSVIAEKTLYSARKDSKQYKQLSQIAKLILSELENGKHPKHIMYVQGTDYLYKCE